GYGFAIPINLAKKVLDDIHKYGAVKRGYVGITFTAIDEDTREKLHTDKTSGLYVDQVLPGGGAAQAGLQEGDIISKVEGNPAFTNSDLQERVGRLEPGDKIHLTAIRGNEVKNFTVTLKADAPTPRVAVSRSAEELFNKLGASFVPLNASQKAKFHVNAGVLVTQVKQGGLFDYTDVQAGSVITEVNRHPIASVADMDRAFSNVNNGIITLSGFYPDGTRLRSSFQVQ
ncbi:MAG: PDZ domain-containing protein, partial [Bacteroidota bacterium]|nr:PDZ domain-containing protein [Bacteroidota bacterium]